MALSLHHSTSRACVARGSSAAARQRALRPVFTRAAPETKIVATEVTDETWEKEVLNSPLPVLIDFWAPWCGPCRMIAPLIDELAGQYQGKLKCLKLNTDESPGVATECGIRSIPTVMIFKDGKKQEVIIGAVPKSTLEQAITKFL